MRTPYFSQNKAKLVIWRVMRKSKQNTHLEGCPTDDETEDKANHGRYDLKRELNLKLSRYSIFQNRKKATVSTSTENFLEEIDVSELNFKFKFNLQLTVVSLLLLELVRFADSRIRIIIFA